MLSTFGSAALALVALAPCVYLAAARLRRPEYGLQLAVGCLCGAGCLGMAALFGLAFA
ncbi:hypothetical protein ACIOG4_38840 [Streptomyces microflavus]|uniref:hypothetical protein n=1 Tax=Streptomyces microflavus TaxID=1919 RepID=UPI003824D0B0